QDDLKHRVTPSRQMRKGRHDAGAVVLIKTVKFADRPFLDQFAGVECAFKHAFAMGWNQQIGSQAADDLERLAKEGAGDFQFVVTQSEIEARCDQYRRM